MRTIPSDARGRQLQAFLAYAGIRSRKLLLKIRPNAHARAQNNAVLDYLIALGNWEGLAPPYPAYQVRFAANQYHFAHDRIAMLALAHSSRSYSARRFERMIAAKLPERPLPGGGTKPPVRGALRLRTCRPSKPKSTWTCDIFALFAAYGAVQQRRDRERELAVVFACLDRFPRPAIAACQPSDLLGSANRTVPGETGRCR
ncbi:hypothetical protein DM450_0165 (plasmid) [Sphingomonas sp. IC081]|nr:hypothetical protein DM450_0165 [Sphingomonas sp. IC081]